MMGWAKDVKPGMVLMVMYCGNYIRDVTVTKRLPSGRWRLSDKSIMDESGLCRCSAYHCAISYRPKAAKPHP